MSGAGPGDGAGAGAGPGAPGTASLPVSGVWLEGSELVFPDLVQLICAYCHTR